ncbi:shikimate-5-dehydrogenase [Periconia macrospinosa]|uniref:Shikimate-5-dehydrogenase n=1 Tax=Periconia macrospinosa TaxID=97972 RepID=A0A2V1E630_9PLEO|nr:shikimate-5-dehydrogenase [Periconia macrospinosa]
MTILTKTTYGAAENASDKQELSFYIFGNNISHSLSPQLHNSGFAKLRYPGHYTIHETIAVDETVERLIRQPNFGGASVTFPHKLQIGKLVDVITPRAVSVGAVNTIIAKESPSGRILEGDNTDWSGIRSCIVKSQLPNIETSTAVVVGAGGAARAACYALQTLKVKDVIIVNRTQPKAEEMAAHFPELSTHICTNLEDVSKIASTPVRVIVACIPADDLTEDKIPASLLSGEESGVLVEMAYRPLETGLMKVASRYSTWRVFRGMDVLKEQAYAQFELWTGQNAPTEVMAEAMEAELKRRRLANPAL